MQDTKNLSRARWLWGALWVLYAALIFYFSSQPFPQGTLIDKVPFGDKWAHLGEYSIFGWLTLKTFEPKKRPAWWGLALLVALAYAASDEFHQRFVPTRTASVYDWSADALGILTSSVVYVWFHRQTK